MRPIDVELAEGKVKLRSAFHGEGAYEAFKRIASEFYKDHTYKFAALTLDGDPKPDSVEFTAEFWSVPSEAATQQPNDPLTLLALGAVRAERQRQDILWGDQGGRSLFEWISILGEEYGELCEAVNETCCKNPAHPDRGGYENIIKEATQVAAVALQIVEAACRRNPEGGDDMKPILFNTDMVRALLDNRKTVTRRVVKPQHLRVLDSPYRKAHPETPDKVLLKRLCEPPCRPGDILYVRETWTKLWYVDPDGYTHYDQPMYYYAADGTPDITLYDEDGFEQDDQRIRWRPSIHMPREAARIFLRVTNVRVERLQDVTEEGAIKEGCTAHGGNLALDEFEEVWHNTLKSTDRALYGWEANPWVWVIEFERISREEAEDGLQRADWTTAECVSSRWI